jgi:hypothetical protein
MIKPILLKSPVLLSYFALTVIVSLTAVQGQSTAQQPAQAPVAQNTTPPAPSVVPPPLMETRAAGPDRISGIPLSVIQRTQISYVLASERGTSVGVNFPLSAGSVVPSWVHLENVPPELVVIERKYSGKRFFVTADGAVIVNPRGRQIISAFTFSDQEAALVPDVVQTMTLNAEQRERIRNIVGPGSATGPARTPKTAAVGDEVPSSVLLKEFPTAFSKDVPQVKSYRYFKQGNEFVIVEPGKRRVLHVIE